MKKISVLALVVVAVMLSSILFGCTTIIPTSTYKYDENQHWLVVNGVEGEKQDHVFSENIIKQSTETETGTMEKTCTVCGYKITVQIPVKEPAHVHTYTTTFWRKDAISHWHEASCGHAVRGDEEQHSFDSGKVTKVPMSTSRGIVEYTCKVCGYTYTEQLKYNHTNHIIEWKYDDDNHWQQQTCCNVNPDQKDNFGAHTYNDYGQCTVCGRKSIVKQVISAIKESNALDYSIVLDNLKVDDGDDEYDMYEYAEMKFGLNANSDNPLFAYIYIKSSSVHTDIPVDGKLVELKAPSETYIIIDNGSVYIKNTVLYSSYEGGSDGYDKIEQETRTSYKVLNISEFLEEIGIEETYFDKFVDKLESYSDAINAILDPISDIYNKMLVANSDAVDVAEKLFESIFVKNETDGTTCYTIDCQRLHDINSKLGTMTIAQVIDYFMGEGFTDKVQSRLADLSDMTITDLIDTAEGYGIEIEDIESLANAYIKYFYKDEEGNTYDSLYDLMLGDMSSTLTAIKVSSVSELLKNEIFNDMTIYDVLELVQSNADESEKISIDEISEKLANFVSEYKTQNLYDLIVKAVKYISKNDIETENETVKNLISLSKKLLEKVDFEQVDAQTVVCIVDAIIDSLDDFADITIYTDEEGVSKVNFKLGLKENNVDADSQNDDLSFNEKVYNGVSDALHNLFNNYNAKSVAVVRNPHITYDVNSVISEIEQNVNLYKVDLSDTQIEGLVGIAVNNEYSDLKSDFNMTISIDHDSSVVIVDCAEKVKKEVDSALVSSWIPTGSTLYYTRHIVINVSLQQICDTSVSEICKNKAILESKIKLDVVTCEYTFYLEDSDGNEIDPSTVDGFSDWQQSVVDGKVSQLEILKDGLQKAVFVVTTNNDENDDKSTLITGETSIDIYEDCVFDLHSYVSYSVGNTTCVSFDGSSYNMCLSIFRCTDCGNEKYVYLKVSSSEE